MGGTRQVIGSLVLLSALLLVASPAMAVCGCTTAEPWCPTLCMCMSADSCPSTQTACGPSALGDTCRYGSTCLAATCDCTGYTLYDYDKPCIGATCTSTGWDASTCGGGGTPDPCSDTNTCGSVALGGTCTQTVLCNPYCGVGDCGCIADGGTPGNLVGTACAGGAGTLQLANVIPNPNHYDETTGETCSGGGGMLLTIYMDTYTYTCVPSGSGSCPDGEIWCSKTCDCNTADECNRFAGYVCDKSNVIGDLCYPSGYCDNDLETCVPSGTPTTRPVDYYESPVGTCNHDCTLLCTQTGWTRSGCVADTNKQCAASTCTANGWDNAACCDAPPAGGSAPGWYDHPSWGGCGCGGTAYAYWDGCHWDNDWADHRCYKGGVDCTNDAYGECCGYCGNSVCETTQSETCASCSSDCGACCGNGVINSGEQCDNGAGNGVCGTAGVTCSINTCTSCSCPSGTTECPAGTCVSIPTCAGECLTGGFTCSGGVVSCTLKTNGVGCSSQPCGQCQSGTCQATEPCYACAQDSDCSSYSPAPRQCEMGTCNDATSTCTPCGSPGSGCEAQPFWGCWDDAACVGSSSQQCPCGDGTFGTQQVTCSLVTGTLSYGSCNGCSCTPGACDTTGCENVCSGDPCGVDSCGDTCSTGTKSCTGGSCTSNANCSTDQGTSCCSSVMGGTCVATCLYDYNCTDVYGSASYCGCYGYGCYAANDPCSFTCMSHTCAQYGQCGAYPDCYPCCTVTSWSPDPGTVCVGQSFTQTSNCGTTRQATGTKAPFYHNNCDSDDVCGNRVVSDPYNGCPLSSATVCGVEYGDSIDNGRCFDGIDNDCDGLPDLQDEDCSIDVIGEVTESGSGDAVSEANLFIVAPPDGYATLSDEYGDYSLSGIPVGVRTMGVAKPGYRAQTRIVDLEVPGPRVEDFELSDGDCDQCADWELRCTQSCSNVGQCEVTVPSVCEGARPGDWVIDATTSTYVLCCLGVGEKPVLGAYSVGGEMANVVPFSRVAFYPTLRATLKVYSWS